MDSLSQKANIAHHRWPNYYDRKEEIAARIKTMRHWLEEDRIDDALEVLENIEIRLKNLERG